MEMKLNFIEQIITGLFHTTKLTIEVAFLHQHHIIHRDLKPSNILVKNNKLKLCDFGCSKQIIGSEENHHSTPLVTSRFYRKDEYI